MAPAASIPAAFAGFRCLLAQFDFRQPDFRPYDLLNVADDIVEDRCNRTLCH